VFVESPDIDAVARLGDCWVNLAREQRAHGSHLSAEANLAHITENIARAIAADSVRVARAEDGDGIDADTDEILGFVMFSAGTEVLATDAVRGTIENLYVRPPYRNRGVGSDLLAAATTALESRGVDAITLDVLAANEAARRFYRRHGYEPHRVRMERPVENDRHTKDDG
jgi:ribosomal protein S18 acetylase RimI-like enzyme